MALAANSQQSLFSFTPEQRLRFYWYLLTTCAALIVIGYVTVFYRLQYYRMAVNLPGDGQTAPAFELPNVSTSNLVNLSDLRGQPVLLTFIALDCDVSLAEVSEIEAFAAKHPDVSTLVIAREDTDQVLTRFGANTYPHIQLLGNGEPTLNAYGVYRTPTSFVIDAAGTVRYVQSGGQSEVRHFENYLSILNMVTR